MMDKSPTESDSHSGWISDMNADFVEIEQLLHGFQSYSLWGELSRQDIYEFVQQRLSVTTVKDITSIIVEAIVSKKEADDLKVENRHLQWEISHLIHKTSSIQKELDVFNIHEGTLDVDFDGTILTVNNLVIEYSWYSQEELIGENMSILSSWVQSRKFWDNFLATIRSWRAWAGDICNRRKDGSFIWLWTLVIPKSDDIGNVVGFKVVSQDVSKSYEALDQKIDRLTGLPNHEKCLEDFRVDANRSIAILHINNMFDINNVFGRKKGDNIVKEIGKILKKIFLKTDVSIYKFEWTDFGLVFKEDMSEECIREQCEILNNLDIFDNEKRIYLSFSLWVALNEPNIEALLRHWYLALKESRQSRKYVIFDDKNHSMKESEDFFEMRNLVREAFQNDLFEVFFQEIKENSCSIKKSTTRKFECLVRMYDSIEKTNLIPPGRFLPIIKKDGENPALTSCVVEKVCKFMSENDGHFSINLTEEDLRTNNFAWLIYEQIDKHSIDPNRIIFEILEAIENIESEGISENIKALRNLGFEIAIDDFWSGYSNFFRMLDFEPDYIKIDMLYIRWIDTNQKHRSLIRAIVGLAHDNGMMVVGEGVETEKEQLVLESLWVDYSQGYLFSKPGPSI